MLHETARKRNTRPQPSLVLSAAFGALTSLALVAVDYLGMRLAGLPFVPFDLFDWLARILPGNVITLGIDSMVRVIQTFGLGPISDTAKLMEQLMGVLMVIAAGSSFGLLLAQLLRRTDREGSHIGAQLGLGTFILVAFMEIELAGGIPGQLVVPLLGLAGLIVGWGSLLGHWLSPQEFRPAIIEVTDYNSSRRDLLLKLAGGSVTVAIAAFGLGKWLERGEVASGVGQPLSTFTNQPPPVGNNNPSAAPTPLAQETAQATLRDRIASAPGTRAEVTANQNWYRTDINTIAPALDKGSWRLKVAGLFDRPRPLTLDDLLAYPPVSQPVTMSCISNPVGGDLISSGTFIGVRLRDVLKDLGLRREARALAIRAADGFYESVPFEELMDPRTLLVYGLNGDALPREHGFPLRIFIPNHYGMKQPKWITSIEAIDRDGPGYWVDRGWSATAYPQIASVIDTVAKDHVTNGRVPVGGIAYAGDRGIKIVEVQVDDGAWEEAALRTPPLGPLTWVQWRYDWLPARGNHVFRVRATDGAGTLQSERIQGTYPDGATGLHSVRVSV